VPHWLTFPLTLFGILCPVAFVLVATSENVFAAANIGVAFAHILEKTLVCLVAPLFVCGLIAFANFVTLPSSDSPR